MNIEIKNKSIQEVNEIMGTLRENGYNPYLSGQGNGSVIIKTGAKN